MPNWGIEHADYATVLGNEFTLNTYRYANKPMFRVPISTPVVYPWPAEKDFETCRKQFLWFGSSGMVHKGLDLVLEAFLEMPEYHLTVCGPVQEEKDFEEAFYKELYQTPNIHILGWIDIGSPEFIEITKNCVGLVYPSCSEGGGGSVISCMHAGVIPIVSYESSVDVDDFGVILKNCSIAKIKDSVRMIAGLSAEELHLMSRKAWEHARANHTRERFAAEYRKVIEKIITARRKNEVLTKPHMQSTSTSDDMGFDRVGV
jgi:glycosyltransferase involved in cell wall biosynthesis